MKKNLAFLIFSLFLCLFCSYSAVSGASLEEVRLSEEDFQPLTPFLREFPGWEGGVIELSLDEDERGGVLSRSYTKGKALLEIRIMIGGGVASYLGGMIPGMLLMESDAVRIERYSFAGFPAVIRQEKGSPAGALAVLLGGERPESSQEEWDALVLFVYEGITSADVEQLAKSVDLQGVQHIVGSSGKVQQ
jgi:hypothetical protein